MRRLALAIATLLLAASAVAGVSAPASAAPADSLYSLVNQERAANGLPALVRNASIESVAVNWANQMAANGAIQHNPNYSSQIPGGWTAAAENIAHGQPTAAEMHRDWMNSPGHRANILGDFTSIGIAFITANGTTWGVQNFAQYPGQAAAPAPPPPAPAPAPAPAPKPAPVAPTTPAPTFAPTATTAPPPDAPPSAAGEPAASAPPGPTPSAHPSPGATDHPARAQAREAGDNPAGAIALLGLVLTAAVVFILRSARRGKWIKHRNR